MAFSSGTSSSLSANPNITPLIDVLLVLLIIFMVIVPAKPHGLEALIAQKASSPELDSAPIPAILRVALQGSDRRLSYRLADHVVAPAELLAVLVRTHTANVRTAVLIDGDPSLDFQAVATVIAVAREAGFQSIGLLPRTQRQFEPGPGLSVSQQQSAGTLSFMRLFTALPLSSTALERLLSLRLRLSAPGDGLRWSTPEQWHVTLQFYGEVDAQVAARLQDGLARLTSAAPEITLSELGMFAAKGILFASIAPSPTLLALHTEVLRVGRDCGFASETRPFRPHITLARSKGKTGNGTLRKLGNPNLPSLGPELSFTADRCLLLESTLKPQGAQYSVKESFLLAPVAGAASHKQEP